jgi:hypothetical protein
MIRTCTCGRELKPCEHLSLTGRAPCPDCGSCTYCWDGPDWFARLFLRRKAQQPRYTPDHPGLRVLGADYGFHPLSTTVFVRSAEHERELFVIEELRITRPKNRWRFLNL